MLQRMLKLGRLVSSDSRRSHSHSVTKPRLDTDFSLLSKMGETGRPIGSEYICVVP
jgi:hypothetical protein